MAMHDGTPKFRAPVILYGDDYDLVIRLRAKLEAKASKALPLAEIIRIALRKLAEVENV